MKFFKRLSSLAFVVMVLAAITEPVQADPYEDALTGFTQDSFHATSVLTAIPMSQY